MSHTPGPWTIDEKCNRWVLDGYGDHIATFRDKKHSARNAANAVAAVNERDALLAALREIQHACRPGNDEAAEDCYLIARDAIARATTDTTEKP